MQANVTVNATGSIANATFFHRVERGASCFASPADGLSLDAPELSFAYRSIATCALVAAALRVSLKLWSDEDGHLLSLLRTLPAIVLAIAYALARWVPESCLSPLAPAHWVVAGVGWVVILRSVCAWAGLQARRVYLLIGLDLATFLNFSVAAYDRAQAASSYVAALGVAAVSLHLSAKLVRETREGDFDADQRACDRLQHLVVLKLGLTTVLAVGPHGLRWFSPLTLAWMVGVSELFAVLLGIRDLRMSKPDD
jgi:hypothetical protein